MMRWRIGRPSMIAHAAKLAINMLSRSIGLCRNSRSGKYFFEASLIFVRDCFLKWEPELTSSGSWWGVSQWVSIGKAGCVFPYM